MGASYSLSKMHLVVNRLRRDLRDTRVGEARFQDEELLSWLRESAHRSFLWIEFDSSTPGVSAATIEVADAETVEGYPDLELVLRRTTDPVEDPVRLGLSDPRYENLALLMRGIRAVGGGWRVGFGETVSINWFLPIPDDVQTLASLNAAGSLASRDIEQPLPELSVYGSRRGLALFQPDRALRRAQASATQGFKSYREKDVSWTAGDDEGKRDAKDLRGQKVFAEPLY